MNNSGGASGLNSIGGTLAAASVAPQPSPNAIPPAPNPHGTGGNYGPPPSSPGSGAGAAHSGVLQVQIVGSVPLNIGNIPSSGGGTGGGGGGMGGGGSIPPSPPAPGGGSSPYGSGFNPFQSGGMGGFLAGVQANPSIGGIASSAVSALSHANPALAAAAGPIGLAFAAMKAISDPVNTGVDGFYASQAPAYQSNTSFMARSIAGGYVSGIERGDTASLNSAQGALSAYQALNHSNTGRFLNFIGLDIPDLIMQRNITPRFDREIAEKQAKLSADLQIARLEGLAGGDVGAMTGPNLGVSTSQAGNAGLFGTRGVSALLNSNPMAFINNRFSQDSVSAALGTVYSAGGQLGQNNMFGTLSGGGDPLGQAYNAANIAIAGGDLSALAALQPLLGSDYGRLYSAAVNSRANLTSQQIGQANLTGLQSSVSLLGATGAGYQAIAGAQRSVAGGYDPLRTTLEYQLRLETNDIKKAQIAAQIQGLDASKAGEMQTAAMTIFQGRSIDTTALSLGASNAMSLGQYGVGGQGGIDAAFGLERTAGLSEADRLYDMSRSPFISPEQRRVYAQQARSAKIAATLGTAHDRTLSDFQYGMSGIGLETADARSVSVQAGLFGDSSSQYDAAMLGVSASRDRYNKTQAYLANPDANISPTTRASMEADQKNALTDLNAAITQASRSFRSMNLSVAETTQGIISMRGSMQTGLLHIGGTDAAGIVGANIGAASDTLSAAQANLDNLKRQGVDPRSTIYKQAEAAVTQAQAGQLQSALAYSSVGPSLANRTRLSEAGFAVSMMSKAPVQWGDMRGAFESEMTAIGGSIKDLNANEQTAQAKLRKLYSGADLDKALAASHFDFMQQRQSLQLQGADAFQNYSADWMSRLTSETVNSPARSAFISSQFSMREAAPFIAAAGGADYNGYFGFGGVGGQKSRDSVMGLYSRLSGPNIGGITRPEDFVGTALSGRSSGFSERHAALPNTGNPGYSRRSSHHRRIRQ